MEKDGEEEVSIVWCGDRDLNQDLRLGGPEQYERIHIVRYERSSKVIIKAYSYRSYYSDD